MFISFSIFEGWKNTKPTWLLYSSRPANWYDFQVTNTEILGNLLEYTFLFLVWHKTVSDSSFPQNFSIRVLKAFITLKYILLFSQSLKRNKYFYLLLRLFWRIMVSLVCYSLELTAILPMEVFNFILLGVLRNFCP